MAKQVAIFFALGLAICLVVPAETRGATIQFSVDPSDIGGLKTDFSASSSDLNGTVLVGQTVSLDLLFANNILARIFGDAFGISLTFQTDAGMTPGFSGPASGYLLDTGGYPIGGRETAGLVESTDGSFSMGLPFLSALPDGRVDISGMHLDVILPNNGYNITNATFSFRSYDSYSAIELGTAQQIPEPSTFIALLTGLLIVIGLGLRKAF